MNNGWVKAHRRLLDHPRFRQNGWLAVWMYLLLNATHQRRQANFDGKIVTLQPGQLITGRLAIAAATGVHESSVKRILAVMKSDQQIDQQAGVKGSIITVRNWQTYQDSDQQRGQQLTSERPATDQRLTTNKKGRRGEGKKASPVVPKGDGYATDFESFWSLYPRKVGKPAAWKAWQKAKPDAGAVRTALEWQVKSDQWTKDGGQFIPHPSKYLNDRRWEDEPQPDASLSTQRETPKRQLVFANEDAR